MIGQISFYSFYAAGVVSISINSRLSIDASHGNQHNKHKLALHNLLIDFQFS